MELYWYRVRVSTTRRVFRISSEPVQQQTNGEYVTQMSEQADNPEDDSSPAARPDELLAGIAADAWQAYNAMETTKRRHFEQLELLENRKKNYNIDPNERDRALLAGLLRDHDEQVVRFSEASVSLKQLDSAAHLALFGYIGVINKAAENRRTTH